MSNKTQAAATWLKNRFGDEEQASERLDDLVHDLASQIGSGINNGGFDSQVDFIVEQCGDQTIQTLTDDFGTSD